MNTKTTTDSAIAGPDPRNLFDMAAVRLTFHPQDLLEQWRAQSGEVSLDDQRKANDVLFDLLEVSVPMMDERGLPANTLPERERVTVLQNLGVSEAQRVLAAIPSEQRSATEHMFSDLLAGGQIDMSSDSVQLSILQTVSRWAAALGLPGAPAPEAIDIRLRHLNFLQTLGGADLQSFVGRTDILQRLHDSWRRSKGSFECVALEGPGGMGKSLTVTRFIAGLLDGDAGECPDAVFHLDFDRLALQQARPPTFWRELIRQSRAWCDPDDIDRLSELAQMVTSGGANIESASEGLRSSQHRDMHYVADALHKIIARQRPARIIMFVDSYEQVDGVDDVAASSPQQVARVLAESGASILLLFASRTFKYMSMERTTHLTLGQFTVEEATDYLQEHAKRAGLVISDQEAQAVLTVAGRSPLGLRLAVALLEKGDHMDGTVPWHQQIESSPEFIHATLYERLLRRLRNKELRKLAAPGLLVRRVTAELIRDVLAVPCKLDLESESPAGLMRAAEREGQLFTRREGDQDALWHRQDVRATMLENVRRFAGETVARQIHERAVAFYQRGTGAIARTEELYHRLCLNQDAHELDLRWETGAGQALRSAIDELPRAAQAYLRARFGAATDTKEPPHNLSEAARDAEFDLLTRKRLLSDGPTAAVLKRWHEAEHRLDGRNGDLFAAALVQTGQHEVMLAAARLLFEIAPEELAHKPASGVLRISGAVLEGRGELPEAGKHWKEAAAQAKWAQDELGELAALVGLIRVTRKIGADSAVGQAERHRALRLVGRLSPGLSEHKVLAREAGAELAAAPLSADKPGPIHPAIIKLLDDVIASNEAFPSLANDPERIAQLSERFLGSRANNSIRNLNSIALRLLRSPDSLGALIATLREEVDLTLARGAWPAAQSGQ